MRRQSGAARPLSETLPATGKVTIDHQTVRYTRPNLTEEYTVNLDGLRQDFIVPTPPDSIIASWTAAAERSGDAAFARRESELVLNLSVTGAKVEPSPDGATLILENSGRKIAYTRLHVTDATGKSLPARIEICPVGDEVTSLKSPDLFGDNLGEINSLTSEPAYPQLSIIINDTDALYPLRIDPTFSDANWLSMGDLPGTDNQVNAAVMDRSGNLYIGGSFAFAGNIPAKNIAKWNGTNWSTLGSGINSNVTALAMSGNTLYAGGWFTVAGGNAANGIAQWDGTNWSALGSGASDSIGSATIVNALAVSGSTLYAAGNFTNAGGIVQWDGTNWSALGSGSISFVSALAVSGSTLHAGGNGGIEQWNGTNWSSLGPLWLSDQGVFDSGIVNALAVSGGILYVGGLFTNAGESFFPSYTPGVLVNNIAQWDGTNWSALGSGITATDITIELGLFINSGVNALAVSGNTLYVGGSFTNAGGSTAMNIAQWDGTNWSALGTGINGTVSPPFIYPYLSALAVSGSTLFAGGTFNTAGGSTAMNIAQWNGSNWSAVNLANLGISGGIFGPYVDALALASNTLYVGGEFTFAGGAPANYIAQWNGTHWSALGSGMNNYVEALAVSGNTLYAGGSFTTADGNPANCIAQWNGTNWSALGSGMSGLGDDGNGPVVYALSVSGNTLYAGGDFTTAGNVPANYIAQWNGTNWSALGSGMSAGDTNGLYVNALAVAGNTLYAGGDFTNAGGVIANGIAQWNGTSWSALGDGMSVGNPYYGVIVYALAVSGDTLYAVGDFRNAGAITANGIAEWNGNTWLPLGSGLGGYDAYTSVFALAVSNNILYTGGAFATAGTNVTDRIAMAILPPSVTILTADGNFGFTNSLFGFDISGPPGSNVVIQASTNLINWTSLKTNTLNPNGLLYFSDSSSPSNHKRFYQAILP